MDRTRAVIVRSGALTCFTSLLMYKTCLMDMDAGGSVQDAIKWLSHEREEELKKEKEHVTELMSAMMSSREQHKSEVAGLKEELEEMLKKEKEEVKMVEEELKSSKEEHKRELAELKKEVSELSLKRERKQMKKVERN